MPTPPRRRRADPLGLWFYGLAILGLARAWLYLVRDGGDAGAVGWAWLAGSLLLACLGLGLAWRSRVQARMHAAPPARPGSPERRPPQA